MHSLRALIFSLACVTGACRAQPDQASGRLLQDLPRGDDEGPARDARATRLASSLWEELARGHHESACGDEVFDYGLEGGIRITACHLASLAPLRERVASQGVARGIMSALQQASPHPIFRAGPHQDALALGHDPALHGDFGRYHPKFVRWFIDHALPAAQDPELLALTKPLYDSKLRDKVHAFELTYQLIHSRPTCYAAQRQAYAESIALGRPHSRHPWLFWTSPDFCHLATHGGPPNTWSYEAVSHIVDPNLARDAVGFWIRRDLDGTREIWREGLARLRQTYEP